MSNCNFMSSSDDCSSLNFLSAGDDSILVTRRRSALKQSQVDTTDPKIQNQVPDGLHEEQHVGGAVIRNNRMGVSNDLLS